MGGYRFKPEHIFMYESPERRARQDPETIVSRVEIVPNDGVVDIGAGTGYIAIHVAKNHPRARVYAVDSQREMIEHLYGRKEAYELKNLDIFQTKAHHTRLKTGSIHHIFMVNLLHDVEEPLEVLAEFNRILIRKGDISIVEPKKVEGAMGPPRKDRLEVHEAVKLMEITGKFKLDAKYEDADTWYQVVFRKK